MDPNDEARRTERQNRQRLRGLTSELNGNTSKFEGDGGTDALCAVSAAQAEIFETVSTTREAAIDATVLRTITTLAKKNASNSSKVRTRPTAHKFTEKLLEDSSYRRSCKWNWSAIGKEALAYIRYAPGIQTTFGSLGAPPTEKKKRAVREKQARPTRETQFVDLAKSGAKSDRPDNAHETLLKTIYNAAEEHTAGGAVDFFQLAINPESFSQSVENIFSLSHLVKDGHLRHHIDERTKRQMISTATDEEKAGKNKIERIQCIVQFDYRIFHNYCESEMGQQPSLIPGRKRARVEEE